MENTPSGNSPATAREQCGNEAQISTSRNNEWRDLTGIVSCSLAWDTRKTLRRLRGTEMHSWQNRSISRESMTWTLHNNRVGASSKKTEHLLYFFCSLVSSKPLQGKSLHNVR
jgi:hypothetical protein